MNKQREVRYIPATELRAITGPDGSRSLQGYGAVFNAFSVDMGGWKETIAPGAFTRCLAANPDLLLLRDHDNSILLARTRSKTLTVEQDSIGLKFNASLPSTTQASDLIALIERGDIDGCSFSFIANKDDWKTDQVGNTVRTLIDVELFEVSVVSEPAYPDTSVSLRNAPKEIRSAIEAKSKRDDDGDGAVEDDSAPNPDTGCTCDCPECVAGDCDDCTNDDCDVDTCSCSQSTESFRAYTHMVLTLAKHRTK
jgi:HK97 family phage prohead protease